jgi:hypothetical protein
MPHNLQKFSANRRLYKPITGLASERLLFSLFDAALSTSLFKSIAESFAVATFRGLIRPR